LLLRIVNCLLVARRANPNLVEQIANQFDLHVPLTKLATLTTENMLTTKSLQLIAAICSDSELATKFADPQCGLLDLITKQLNKRMITGCEILDPACTNAAFALANIAAKATPATLKQLT
jgi:hypothetical protein